MDSYTVISLVILAGPLALSFDSKVAFYQYWPGVLAACFLVGGLYTIWDIGVTRRGHWTFNPKYTGTLRVWGLPLGEVLFFFAVPYACLFIYEVVVAYFGDSLWFQWPLWLSAVLVLISGLTAWKYRDQGYTRLVMLSLVLFFLVQLLLVPDLLATRAFWIFLFLSFLAFLVFNGLYTALPTIWYNPRQIWGLKAGTIPLEDFFYNFSLLGLSLVIHLTLRGGLPWLQ
ncbi:lycopene cyclase domain-containing protein [Alkalispirochaeta americana]|uniref:Lycopene cyclase domain-containing protein n=1 Tax=Alkalispirochaeta americana TaxID=159291 RepID=A0A1N6U4N7_9SPIO|nr:lycopene cyclase domain-containing protein [Alkalispirochaeta americana]SIQ60286.1 lycopene cyclase domain-containing protein [Alkalispirochaeta americana]